MVDPGIVVDTPNGIRVFRFLARKGALALEIKGLRRSRGRSVYSICKEVYNLKGNKQRVHDQMEAMYQRLKAGEPVDEVLGKRNR